MRSLTPETAPALYRGFQFIQKNNVEGDYLEFGLYQGYTFWKAQEYSKNTGFNGNFVGFDSFEGLPALESPDDGWSFFEGAYACSFEEVKANLVAKKAFGPRTILVPGWYSETLVERAYDTLDLTQVAMALIDCDLYVSTKPVLKFLGPLLQNNSVLVFDDWNCFEADDNKGQRRALREFLDRNPHLQVKELFSYDWHGQAFSVVKD